MSGRSLYPRRGPEARREASHQKVLKKATESALFRKFLREVLLEEEETEQFHLLRNFIREI